MSVDERGRQAAEGLRAHVLDDLAATDMLASVQRTRTRRRLAVVAPAAALVVAVAAALTATPPHDQDAPIGPGPSTPTSTTDAGARANGALFGGGTLYWSDPMGLIVPPIGAGSSPTWSPDGSHVAVLAAGDILVTEVHSGETRKLPCPACTEIAWSPDGRTFAATRVDTDGPRLVLLDASTGETRPVPLYGISLLRSVTWAPDSRTLAFLATSPASEQGGWTVRTDGSRPQQFLDQPTTFHRDDPHAAQAMEVRWSPAKPSLAVLFATPDDPGPSFGGQVRVDVQTMHPDGSTEAHLVSGGDYCTCTGFAPNLVWAPDGRTLGLSSVSRALTVNRVDGDGDAVDVRFLPGASGPLSWQPLPAGP